MIWHALYDPEMPSSGKTRFGLASQPPSELYGTDEESEYSSDDPADAIGQLSLNEKEQVWLAWLPAVTSMTFSKIDIRSGTWERRAGCIS